MEKIYTPQEVADMLKVEINSIYRFIKEGQLKAIKVGKNYRIKEKDLEEYLA